MEHTDLKLLGKSGLRIPSIGMGTWGLVATIVRTLEKIEKR